MKNIEIQETKNNKLVNFANPTQNENIKTSKKYFLKGFFNGLMDSDNDLSQVVNEFNFILQMLYKNKKINICELNALESIPLKINNSITNIISECDCIAIKFGDIWKL